MVDRLLLIDGSSQIYRAIYSNRYPRATRNGLCASGVATFLDLFEQLDHKFMPTHLCMAMDCPRDESMRRKMFPAYKAQRGKRDPDIMRQFGDIVATCRWLGIPMVEKKHTEADDIIATMAWEMWEPSQREITIISRDKDMHQLVRLGVEMFEPISGTKMDAAAVEKKWGVPPAQVPEIQCLTGDSIDNIPGCEGFGPKRATAAIQKWGTVRKMAANPADLTPVLQQRLAEFDIKLGMALVRLQTDLELFTSRKDIAWNGVDTKKVARLRRSLGA